MTVSSILYSYHTLKSYIAFSVVVNSVGIFEVLYHTVVYIYRIYKIEWKVYTYHKCVAIFELLYHTVVYILRLVYYRG